MRCGTGPAKFVHVRSAHGLLLGAASVFVPWTALAQSPAPQAPPTPPAKPLAPVVKAAPAPPVEEPPYNPDEHGGLSFGAYIRAARGTARRSTGMMVTGIVLDVVGATLLATGTGVWVNGNKCHPEFLFSPSGASQQRCGPMNGHTVGMSLMASGLVGLAIGLPLTVYGAAEVPRWEAAGKLMRPFDRASVAFVTYEGSELGRPGLAGLGSRVTLRF